MQVNKTIDILNDIARDRIIVMDGAMGTMIQQHKLQESDFRGSTFEHHLRAQQGNNDLLSITQPEIITNIHLQYYEAGADIIETNTFNAQTISMADYGMESEIYTINHAAVHCALQAREQYYAKHGFAEKKFIAGAIGPTNRTASLSPDVNNPGFRNITFDELVQAYTEQVQALLEAGVDILLVETIFDTLNAKAAFFAIINVFELLQVEVPLMASGTITDASGRTLSGQTATAFGISLSHLPLWSIGFNCALGATQLETYIQEIGAAMDCLISAYPNAGLPNEMGMYDEGPQEMSQTLEPYLEKQLVNIIGGCCGTTPQHIRAMKELARRYSPRKIN